MRVRTWTRPRVWVPLMGSLVMVGVGAGLRSGHASPTLSQAAVVVGEPSGPFRPEAPGFAGAMGENAAPVASTLASADGKAAAGDDQENLGSLQGPQVIRTAHATLRVDKGSLDAIWQSLVGQVTSAGGIVSAADTEAQQGSVHSVTLTFSVPSDRFQSTLDALRKTATLESLNVTADDVSQESVDLAARERSLGEQRAAIEALLGRASSIADIISIRQELAPIQDELERIQGRRSYLDHSTSYSTITVDLHEPDVLPATTPAPPSDEWGLHAAAQQAKRNIATILSFLVIAFGTAAPFLLAGLLFLVGVARFRPRVALATPVGHDPAVARVPTPSAPVAPPAALD